MYFEPFVRDNTRADRLYRAYTALRCEAKELVLGDANTRIPDSFLWEFIKQSHWPAYEWTRGEEHKSHIRTTFNEATKQYVKYMNNVAPMMLKDSVESMMYRCFSPALAPTAISFITGTKTRGWSSKEEPRLNKKTRKQLAVKLLASLPVEEVKEIFATEVVARIMNGE